MMMVLLIEYAMIVMIAATNDWLIWTLQITDKQNMMTTSWISARIAAIPLAGVNLMMM